MKPDISVILPVYNAEKFISKALDSILAQTFQNFEIIVINDGSTDKTPGLLAKYSDPRIRITSRANKGLVASLQEGIALAKAPIIARHDADDISKPDRFKQQLALLDEQPDVVLVGSSMTTIDMDGKKLGDHYVLLDDPEIKQELLVRSPFPHGSVMFRRQSYLETEGYKQSEWPAEDYGLWLRLAKTGKFANINTPLYSYRENTAGISSLNTTKQQMSAKSVQDQAWRQRQTLIQKNIAVAKYVELKMGQFRIERIAKNLRTSLVWSIRKLDLVTTIVLIRVILRERLLLRKYAHLLKMSVRKFYAKS